jgi:manganese/zinc/iron transport system substrate-binding protein
MSVANTVRALLAALLAAVAGGCGAVADTGVQRDVSGRTIRAVATIGMIADVAENVGGERMEVTALMGPGVDPHLYKASEGDVIRLAEADVVLYNGLHLEAKMADVFERMRGRVLTVPVGEAVPRSVRLAPPDFSAAYDPHVWFDVRLWMLAGERVRDTLAELDPAHASTYRVKARRYLLELAELDRYVRSQAARVPREQRVLITAHDAFKYFGRAYGFDVRGLQGISTATESGARDIQRLADFIAERKIRAIFVESSVSPRMIEAVQEAVEARGFDVEIGGQLYSDAMGDPGTPEGTYIGMVRHNIDTIVAGLLGHADA